MTAPQTMIACTCPGCGREIRVPGRFAGMQTVCPKCSTRQLVPRATVPAPEKPRPSPARPSAGPISPTRSAPPPRPSTAPRPSPPSRDGGRLRGLAIGGAGIAAVATLCLVIGVGAVRGRSPQPGRPPSAPAAGTGRESTRPETDPAREARGEAAEAGSAKPPVAEPAAEAVAEAEPSGFSRRLPPPHPPEELRVGLGALDDALQTLASGGAAAEREAALVRLRMYRFLCGLSAADLVLDDRLNEEALAAADICRRLGKLTHAPENPGLDADDYARACRGAGSGNLAWGIPSLPRAVDGWMDDSDAANIDVLGHRRWCLNPPLRRVGFGRTESWCAMWAHDGSGGEPCPLAAVCYPPPGQVPTDLFRPGHAWSVSLNPRFFRRPGPGEIRVQVRDATGVVLDLEREVLETNGYGIGNCVIFRPRDLSTAVGARYEVTITGVRDRDDRTGSLVYDVEFMAR